MMWGYGQNLWWMWLWGALLLIGVAVLVLLAVRVFSGTGRGPQPGHPGPYGQPGFPGRAPGTPGGKSPARLILDERFAKGELTAEQYREHVKELGEGP
ncbi:SHOCT domain-containing protein [uncultured Arthrobacter sp.]|uniref:SHOCT domain-containing protein n=1 Tax=uncultured Arthrobacter sp. TaxID=114050 RepID=UPI0032168209